MSRKGVKAESWALVRGVGEGVHHEWGLERGELFFDGSTVGDRAYHREANTAGRGV